MKKAIFLDYKFIKAANFSQAHIFWIILWGYVNYFINKMHKNWICHYNPGSPRLMCHSGFKKGKQSKWKSDILFQQVKQTGSFCSFFTFVFKCRNVCSKCLLIFYPNGTKLMVFVNWVRRTLFLKLAISWKRLYS